jgi:hypothetical protein
VAGGVGGEGMMVLGVACEEVEGNDIFAACDEAITLVGEDLARSEVGEEVAILKEVLWTTF